MTESTNNILVSFLEVIIPLIDKDQQSSIYLIKSSLDKISNINKFVLALPSWPG
jgi:hypothetical protein